MEFSIPQSQCIANEDLVCLIRLTKIGSNVFQTGFMSKSANKRHGYVCEMTVGCATKGVT